MAMDKYFEKRKVLRSVRMGKKKNRNAMCPNAERVRWSVVCAEDRAPKARGVSMQLVGLGSAVNAHRQTTFG